MDSSIKQATQYLEKKFGVKLFALPIEHFKNSVEEGYGVRMIIGGTKKAFRFNWSTPGGDLGSVVSIDVWDGTSHDPVANIHVGGNARNLIRAIPEIADIIANPQIGEGDVVVTESVEQAAIRVMTEAAKKWTPEAIVDTALQFISKSSKVSKMQFASIVGYPNSGVIDLITEMYPDSFEKQGKSVVFTGEAAGLDRAAILKELTGRSVQLTVVPGGKNETYGATDAEKEIEDELHVPYKKQMAHLEKLVKALAKGAFNALMVAGIGGTGKTHITEQALADLGLKDGEGYFKQTGATSAIGIYSTMYNNRKGIILFDDCDSALADQDARNLIKAATDTKKERKMAWGKRSSMMYDPQNEEVDEEEDGVDKFPRYFNFEGRIIFISNLSPDKLDPDGAIRSRAMMINIHPTKDEMFDMMNEILPKIQIEAGEMSPERRQEVMNVVQSSQRKDVSLRKLVRALNIAASGVEGWEELVELYA